MKILRGFVAGVARKGSEEKPYALVGINCISKDRDGFEESKVVKFMVAGQQYKEGLHNAYRGLVGSEVFAPYSDELDEFNGKYRIRYSLQGIPLRLQDAPEQTQTAPKPAAVAQQPAQAKAS